MTSESPTAPVVTTFDEMFGDVTARQPMTGGASKSGADLERVTIGEVSYFVKYLDMTRDWTMRAAGVDGGASLELWRRGLLRDLPACFDQPIVAVARGRREQAGPEVTALRIRDVS